MFMILSSQASYYTDHNRGYGNSSARSRTPIVPLNHSSTHIYKDLIYLLQLPLSHSLPTPTLTLTHINANTKSNCSLKNSTHVHPDLLHCFAWSPCLLDILAPLSNHYNKLFSTHWLRNIRLGMTISQNTACTNQIIKIDLDYLHLYNFSTRPPSIQEITEYKLFTYKHALKFDRISHSFIIHPQKQSSTH